MKNKPVNFLRCQVWHIIADFLREWRCRVRRLSKIQKIESRSNRTVEKSPAENREKNREVDVLNRITRYFNHRMAFPNSLSLGKKYKFDLWIYKTDEEEVTKMPLNYFLA